MCLKTCYCGISLAELRMHFSVDGDTTVFSNENVDCLSHWLLEHRCLSRDTTLNSREQSL